MQKIKNKNATQLKDFFEKSYILNHSENYEEFLQELGVKKKTRNQAINSKPTVVLSQVNDEEYVLDTTYPEGRRVKVKFRIGEGIQRRRSGGCPTTSVFYIVDNKLIEEQYADDKKVLIQREFEKDNLTVMMEVNKVQCYRFYTLKTSSHSIETETSRRFSLWDTGSESETCSPLQSASTTIKNDSDEDLCF